MALLVDSLNLLSQVVDFVLSVLTLLDNRTLLCSMHLLLIEVLTQFAPASTFALLLILHFTLLVLVLNREVVEFLVKAVDFFLEFNLLLTERSIIRFTLGVGRHKWNDCLLRNVKVLSEVAPLSSHELAVLALVHFLGLIRLILGRLSAAINLRARRNRLLALTSSLTASELLFVVGQFSEAALWASCRFSTLTRLLSLLRRLGFSLSIFSALFAGLARSTDLLVLRGNFLFRFFLTVGLWLPRASWSLLSF